MLVPTQLVPAVQALQREAVPIHDACRARSITISPGSHVMRGNSWRVSQNSQHFPTLQLPPMSCASRVWMSPPLPRPPLLIDAASAVLNRLRGHPRERRVIEEAATDTNAAEALNRAHARFGICATRGSTETRVRPKPPPIGWVTPMHNVAVLDVRLHGQPIGT